MTNGPTVDIKLGRGCVSLFEQLACFIRGRMLATQFLEFIPIRPSVEHDVTGSEKQRPEPRHPDE
jgi:hypothetical protein